MKKNLISGVFLLILALIFFSQARGLLFWGRRGPAEGFFPLVLSILLGLLSLLMILQAWGWEKSSHGTLKIVGPDQKKFVLYLASFFVFGLVFARVGFSLTLAAFFIFIFRVVEKQSWKVTLAVTGGSILVSYVLFIFFLSVSLPEGILSFLFE